jgi:putative ABC transport system permease protein
MDAMMMYTLRHAFRLLVRERGFTAAAVLTLALGVGANVAIFAVVEAVLLRPLPYASAGELITVQHRDERTGITKAFIAIGDFIDLAARQDVFESFGSYGGFGATVAGPGDPFLAAGLAAGPGLFETLRVSPALGRALRPDDMRPGAAPVAMLGHHLWSTTFGSDPAIIGRSIRIGAIDRQIVGISPSGFQFPPGERTDVIVAMTVPLQAPAARKSGWAFGIERLKPGVTAADAAANLGAISRQLEREYPAANAGSLYYPMPLRDALLGESKQPLMLLIGAVAVVLLIACVNVGNLLLARGLSRRQEMAVRIALGAGRARLAAQLAAESLVLTLAAGAAGAVVAQWAVPALVSLVPRSVAIPGLAEVGINAGVLAFTLGICGLTAVVFALISVLMVRGESGAGALVAQTRVTLGTATRRATSVLVVAEVALAVVLLIGAGLILRSFARLVSVDPGFAVDRVAVLSVALPADRYRDAGARQAFHTRASEAVASLPGVERAGIAAVVPLTGNNWTVGFERADRPLPAGERPPDVGWQSASAGYFETLRIPLREGRLFQSTDVPGGPTVVIISEAIAARFFPGESPIGRRVKLGQEDSAEIIGIVGNIRRAALTDEPRADMYFPSEQGPPIAAELFVRTSGDPLRAMPSVRQTLRSIERGIILDEATTMEAVAAESMATIRLALWLLGLFALIALALAAVGIYGVMSYVVRQRTREIGTRIALGATRGDIFWAVMRQGVVITGAGLAIGLAAGLLLAQSLASLLHGTSSADPAALGGALAVLACATLCACYLPARRAARTDPARTLAGDRT